MDTNLHNNPSMDIHAVIAANLAAWMEATPSLDTLKKVEAKSGLGFGTIRRARKAEGNVTVETLEALAKAFGRTPIELLTPANYAAPSATDLPAAESGPTWTTERDRRVSAILELLDQTDDYGVVAVLEKAREIAQAYPRRADKTAS